MAYQRTEALARPRWAPWRLPHDRWSRARHVRHRAHPAGLAAPRAAHRLAQPCELSPQPSSVRARRPPWPVVLRSHRTGNQPCTGVSATGSRGRRSRHSLLACCERTRLWRRTPDSSHSAPTGLGAITPEAGMSARWSVRPSEHEGPAVNDVTSRCGSPHESRPSAAARPYLGASGRDADRSPRQESPSERSSRAYVGSVTDQTASMALTRRSPRPPRRSGPSSSPARPRRSGSSVSSASRRR